MPNTVKLNRTKVNVCSLIANKNLVRRLASNRSHSSKPAGGSVRGGVKERTIQSSQPQLETVKWFPLKKKKSLIVVVGRQLFGVFGHRKLSSTRSLQSRHISSKSVMSSRVSPSRLGNVELLEPVSMALSSDV